MANLRVDQFAIAPALTLADIIPVVPQPGTAAKQTTLQDVKTLLKDDTTLVLMMAGVFLPNN